MSTDPAVVLRKSALGDVVLTGSITGALAPVILVTAPAWAPVAARLPGVVEVRPWAPAAMPARARLVVDLQVSPASRRLCRHTRGPVRRLDPARLRRHLRVLGKCAPPAPLVARYAQAAGVAVAPHPWIRLDRAPAPALLALAPGAAWATKRWPVAHWAALASRWPGPLALLGGPGDADRCAAIAARLPAERPAPQICCEQGFSATFAALASARAVVAGDTGLLHLAAACGVPVLGIFGPTTAADGHWCHPGETVARDDLPCRPCSRFGSARCPAGDHLCMAGLAPGVVAGALDRLLARGTAP